MKYTPKIGEKVKIDRCFFHDERHEGEIGTYVGLDDDGDWRVDLGSWKECSATRISPISKSHPRKPKTEACRHVWSIVHTNEYFVKEKGVEEKLFAVCQHCLEKRVV